MVSLSLDFLSDPAQRWLLITIIMAIVAVVCTIVYQITAEKPPIRVSSLTLYPIKSCGGISVKSAVVDWLGFKLDRRWMIVNTSDNNFITIRQYPRMCLIQPRFVFPTAHQSHADAHIVGSDASKAVIEKGVRPHQLIPFNAVEPIAMVLSAPGVDDLTIPLQFAPESVPADAQIVTCTVWRTPVLGRVLTTAAKATDPNPVSEWISNFLGIKNAGARLVQVITNPNGGGGGGAPAAGSSGVSSDLKSAESKEESSSRHHRPINAKFNIGPNNAQTDVQVAYADGFPFLVASDASLYDLNQRLIVNRESKTVSGGGSAGAGGGSERLVIPMRSFRPNITVGSANRSGLTPWEEDFWADITIGGDTTSTGDANPKQLIARVAKPCSRCSIPNVDQSTGVRRAVNEPTQTLQSFREVDDTVYFGQNLIHANPTMAARNYTATVTIGDIVTVKSRKTDFFDSRVAVKKSNIAGVVPTPTAATK